MAKLNIEGFKPAESSARESLPANQAFVCKILATKIENTSFGDRLIFQLEIIEGEYKGFYKRDYDAQAGGQYDQKYRGVFRVNIPSSQSNHYDWDLRAFNGALGAIEASNTGYHFADTMETNTLKGKTVGIVTRESEYNDRVFTEIGMFISADRARNGNFKPMKRRGSKVDTEPVAATTPASSDIDDDDLPF